MHSCCDDLYTASVLPSKPAFPNSSPLFLAGNTGPILTSTLKNITIVPSPAPTCKYSEDSSERITAVPTCPCPPNIHPVVIYILFLHECV